MTHPAETPTPPGHRPRLVLITGAGRSGTSSLAGTMNALGVHVPGPWVGAKERNPKGHFETLPVVALHKRHIDALAIGRSLPLDDLSARLRDYPALADFEADLEAILTPESAPDIAVKDPHAVVLLESWRRVADRLGRELHIVTAIRHPADVVGSRDKAWGAGRDEAAKAAKEVVNVAEWLNMAVITERLGRGVPRAFISYAELVADWRSAIGRASAQSGLALEIPTGPHAVDDFLEAGLTHRHPSWDDVRISARLRGLAQEAWEALVALGADPVDQVAMSSLDQIALGYAELHREARLLAAEDDDRKRERLRAKLRGRINQLKQRVQEQDDEIESLRAAASSGALGRVGRALRRR